MEIRPFRGWRYGVGDVSDLLAPPYDVLSGQDKKDLLARSERNIVAVDMPHVPPKEVGPDDEYRQAAGLLEEWKTSGVLGGEAAPALYAYQQSFTWGAAAHTRTALIAGVRASELGKDVVPHEHTFAGPKADRLKLMQYTRMQLSPIFGFFRDVRGQVGEVLVQVTQGPPDLRGELRGVQERLWTIRDGDTIARLARLLRRQKVFIADGHHRYTTALNYRDWLAARQAVGPDHEANFVMFALVSRDDPGLLILPTHRIIRNLRADFSIDRLAQAAGEFEWTRCEAPAEPSLERHGPHAMGLIGAGASEMWVARLARPSAMTQAAPDQLAALRKLDVAILHELIVEGALAAWRTDQTAIDYTPDARAVLEACRSGGAQLGVCLQPTPLRAVEAIAKAGAAMPHKSTYFYPKLATGMVLKPLE